MSEKTETGKNKVFYGWIVAASAFLMILMTAAPVSYGGSVITTRIVAERGWSEAVIGSSLSVHYVIMAMVGIPASLLLQRIGFRRIYCLAFSINLICYLFLAFWNRSEAGYTAAFGVLGFAALVGAVLCSTGLVNTWFRRNRSLPMAVVLSAGGVGGFIYPLITQALCNISTRTCWLCFASLQIAGILISLVLVRDRPEDMGEISDGRVWVREHPEAELTAETDGGDTSEPAKQREPSLSRCYRSRAFLILAFQFFLAKCVPGAVLSYVILFAVQRGVPQDSAVWILTLYSVFGLMGRLSSGIVDRIPVPPGICYAMSFTLVAGGLTLMSFAGNELLFFIGGAVVGGAFGFIYVLQYLLMPRYFGNSNYNAVNGTLSTTSFLGNAMGSFLVLVIAGLTGSYMYAYLTMAGICVLGAVLALVNKVQLVGAEDD